MTENIRKIIEDMAEKDYKEFSSALIPGCENMLGVRLPELKKLAKQLVKENSAWRELLAGEDIYFEEVMLRGYIIGFGTAKEDDFEKAVKEFWNFVPLVDNWSVNDSFCGSFSIVDRYRDEFIPHIQKLIYSKDEFEARIGLIMLLDHYLKIDADGKKKVRLRKVDMEDISSESGGDGKYIDMIIELTNRDFGENGYYTQMAAGWLLAEAFVVFPEKIWDFLSDKDNLKLDDISYHKAIRKICESKTPSDEVKQEIKKLLQL